MKFGLVRALPAALLLSLSLFAGYSAVGQVPSASPAGKSARDLAARLDQLGDTPISRADREAAFAKLMEAQRYYWTASRTRSQSRAASANRVARQSFLQAVELNPRLAEAYTALAELEITQNPGEAQVDEAIALAKLAVRVGPDNFGARRLMARLYSYKAKVGGAGFDRDLGERAATEWREVTRLDPRNAEAWAFLSAIYERQGDQEKRVEALRKWLGAAAPVDTQFYRFVMGARETLSPESAAMKLGGALIKGGQTREAIEVLSNIIADDPSNVAALELLRDAVESAEGTAATAAIEALQQAVYASPENTSMIALLARIYVRANRSDDAQRLFDNAVGRLAANDRTAAGTLYATLGEVFADAGQHQRAVAAYEKALRARGLDQAATLSDDERIFAMQVFEKLIDSYKKLNDVKGATSAIDRARKLFGKDDLFADRQLISLYRDEGRRREALDTVRAVRARFPDDYGLVRLEATLLTELGNVDEAVAVFTKATESKPAAGKTPAPMMQDEFSNYLFISNLYSQANRGQEAAAAANKAYEAARGNERKQIARLTLATAQNLSGDHAGAEATLREILKQSPENPIALNNLGYFLLVRGERIEEAKTMIEKAVSIDPTNPSYLDSLGWANFKLGNLTEAERYLREAARYDPSSATIQDHLGDLYLKQGRSSDARAAWERALRFETDPEDIKRIRQKLQK